MGMSQTKYLITTNQGPKKIISTRTILKVIGVVYSMEDINKDKQNIVNTISTLGKTSQCVLYHFFKEMSLNFTSNSNGYFFVISELGINDFKKIQIRVDELLESEAFLTTEEINKHSNNLICNRETKDFETKIPTVKTKIPFECDSAVFETMERSKTQHKKNMYSKYSTAKKKYNKSMVRDLLKFDDSDLNEFESEEYIL